MDLKNKTALVTGASSGIGQVIAISLAKEGCDVVFTFNTNEKGAGETKKEIEKLNVKVDSVRVDLASEADIIKLFKEVENKHGKLDILINNAATNEQGGSLDAKFWRNIFEVDLFSIVSSIEKAVKIMKTGSKIVNISSVYGNERVGHKNFIAYSTAKSALNSFTRTLAKKLAPKIYVNAIAPGYVVTPMWGKLTEKQKKDEGQDQLIERMIEPSEIADMAIAVIKNDAMMGEIVYVDGGISLKTV